MNKYAYFPGCSLKSSAKEYDNSTRQVAAKLGIELVELPDWNCCGASSAHSLNFELDLALNARNLSLASGLQLDLLVPCASCYHRLAAAKLYLSENGEPYRQICRIVGEKLDISARVKSTLEAFTTADVLNTLQREARKSLSGLKVAAYYGCQVMTPARIGFDNPESPVTMDRLIAQLGGESLPWPYKTECCGAGLSLTEPDISLELIKRLLTMAGECGADCIITACPLCQVNLDLGQAQLRKKAGWKHNLPVLYFTQLMGLVLGLAPRSIGLNRHFIEPSNVLHHVGLI